MMNAKQASLTTVPLDDLNEVEGFRRTVCECDESIAVSRDEADVFLVFTPDPFRELEMERGWQELYDEVDSAETRLKADLGTTARAMVAQIRYRCRL